ncbi:hypothetical protein CYLTODRAFT_440186 [Cylindrobasidium torrendii FP15055 ss-10]|uniref:Uncharacterized protein n=1 Tax=Cylindrobasidium torrendii FP15055 ss-10 TaxID=1314674 RepID=A0A0D7BSA2_9AGAR|nr:hypothetical protein CYLTODRAFT_440186 [Cylindrobasidium torrendii FP15055 ss-10]
MAKSLRSKDKDKSQNQRSLGEFFTRTGSVSSVTSSSSSKTVAKASTSGKKLKNPMQTAARLEGSVRAKTSKTASPLKTPDSSPPPAELRKVSGTKRKAAEGPDDGELPMTPPRPRRCVSSKYGTVSELGLAPSTPSARETKRVRSGSLVPPSEPEEEEMKMPEDSMDVDASEPIFIPVNASPATPPPRQQHTPPSDWVSPRTKRTAQAIADIRARAQAFAMTSPPASPIAEDHYFDSSDEEDDLLTDNLFANIKPKNKLTPSPSGSSAGSPAPRPGRPIRNRKPTVTGPVILTQSARPKKTQGGLAIIQQFNREKKRDERGNRGEKARLQAESFIEDMTMDEDDSDDDSLPVINPDPFGLKSFDDAADILGGDEEHGAAVRSILVMESQASRTKEKRAGIPLWEQPADDAMDAEPGLPTFESDVPSLQSFAKALRESNENSIALMLTCGLLRHPQHAQNNDIIDFIWSLALSCRSGPIPEAAFTALVHAQVALPKLTIVLSALRQMGMPINHFKSLMLDTPTTDVLDVDAGERDAAITRMLKLITMSAMSQQRPNKDVADLIMAIALVSLDDAAPSARDGPLIDAMQVLCGVFPAAYAEDERALTARLVALITSLEVMNQTHVLDLFASGCGCGQRIARVAAHCVLNKSTKPVCTPNGLPPLVPLLKLVADPDDDAAMFKLHDEADYVAMGHYIRILSIAINDVQGYVLEAKKDEPVSEGGNKIPSSLELLHSGLDVLHSRIVDTRAAKLERSRTKALIKTLSMRLHFQFASASASAHRTKQMTLANYMKPQAGGRPKPVRVTSK